MAKVSVWEAGVLERERERERKREIGKVSTLSDFLGFPALDGSGQIFCPMHTAWHSMDLWLILLFLVLVDWDEKKKGETRFHIPGLEGARFGPGFFL